MNFSLFLVEFCQYLEYSIRFFKLFAWNLLVTNFFLSFVFNCKKNIELIFLKLKFIYLIEILLFAKVMTLNELNFYFQE